MSKPITPTPKFNMKETEEFLRQIEEGLKHPVGLVPTPKLEEVHKRIIEDMTRR